MNYLAPNTCVTKQFLSYFDGILTFQIFDDRKAKNHSKDSIKPVHFSGTLQNNLNLLTRANENGAGIFFMVNEGDGEGRKAKNVTRVRALFVDLDGAPIQPILSAKLQPHIIVESSPGRFHAYWLVSNCKLEEFRHYQKSLADKFAGDSKVKDLSRVMRLPGFFHHKETPFQTKIYKLFETPHYSIEELIECFDLNSFEKINHTLPISHSSTRVDVEDVKNALNFISADDREIWLKVGAAIYSEWPDEYGFNIWNEWSKSSLKYDENTIQRDWGYFTNFTEVTIKSLFFLANDSGYAKNLATRQEVEVNESIIKAENNNKERDKKSTNAIDYVNFIQSLSHVKKICRELLTDELMVLTPNNGWIPAANLEHYFKGHARGYKKAKLYVDGITEFLEQYKLDHMKPDLTINIPVWDQIDRLNEIATSMIFENIDQEGFYYLIKEWGAKMFRRAMIDHTIQPDTIILVGSQGCGKDVLIKALTGGLDSYAQNLNLSGFKMKEAEEQLHRALVFTIPEFSRTTRDAAVIKHLLTVSDTDVRLPYDRRPQKRKIRCSFIGSDNLKNPLTDYTGNRRFQIFQAEYMGFNKKTGRIEQDYPGHFSRKNFKEEQLQILAQFKHLAGTEYQAPEKYIQQMRTFINDATPEDPAEGLLKAFDLAVEQQLSPQKAMVPKSSKSGFLLFNKDQLEPVLQKLSSDFQIKPQNILKTLGEYGRREKRSEGNYYRVPISKISEAME